MRITTKQRQIMDVVIQATDSVGSLDIDELIEQLPYITTKASLQFSIRALISHDLLAKGDIEKRRGRQRRVICPTQKTYDTMRTEYEPADMAIHNGIVEYF